MVRVHVDEYNMRPSRNQQCNMLKLSLNVYKLFSSHYIKLSLQPLPVSEHPWALASMDIIIGLSVVDGKRLIFMVIDHFSKYIIFMAAPAYCLVEEAVALFLTGVVKYFGLLSDIVSDWDVRFTSWFCTSLFHKLGTWLKFSMANHA